MAHKLITKILWHTKKYIYIFCQSDKKVRVILIHSHQTAIVVLMTVPFLFDNLRKKRSESLTKQSGVACFKNSAAQQLKIVVVGQ